MPDLPAVQVTIALAAIDEVFLRQVYKLQVKITIDGHVGGMI